MIGGASGFNRYSFRTNVVSDVKDWLEVGANVTFSNSNNRRVSENDSFRGVIQNALIIDPLTPVFYEDGEVPQSVFDRSEENGVPVITAENSDRVFGYPTFVTGEVLNPVASASVLSNDNEEIDYFLGSTYAKFKIAKGLDFTTRLGVERRNLTRSQLSLPYFVSAQATNGSYGLVEQSQRDSKWLWENFVNYNFDVGSSNFNFLAGYSAEKNEFSGITSAGNVSVEDFTSPFLDFFETSGTVGGFFRENTLNSVFG